MNKWLAAAVPVLFAALLAGCGPATSPDGNVIKIGHTVALTGDSSMWGQAERNALLMEIDKINAKGGVLGKKLQLVAYDNRADATEGVNVAKRLINQDKVVAIIGPAQSGVAIATNSVTEPAKVPFIATTATNPKVTMNDKSGKVQQYAFRTCFIDPFQGTVAGQFAIKDLNAKTAAVIYDVGSDYSSWLGKYFIDEFTKQGGTIVANEAFRSGELDYRAILGKIKQQNPDVLFIPTMQKEAALIMKQSADLGLKPKFLGGDGWGSPDLITLGGSLVNAISTANSTEPAKIAAQLARTKALPVLTGKLTIDPATHDPLHKPAIIQVVKDGKFVYQTKFVTD